jgi:hypothetical protein
MIVVAIVVLFKFAKKQKKQNDDNVGYHFVKFKKKIKQEDGFFLFYSII